jgi:DNA adenine methylase
MKVLNPLDDEQYYEIRAAHPKDRFRRAAYFIYLNKTCWNGLYRVNSRGQFNVPYGSPRTDSMPDPVNVRACAKLLQQSQVRCRVADFQVAVKNAGEGDLLFFDPPYVTGHNNNGFIDYNETLFSWSDQVRLSTVAKRLADKGAHVIVTNAYHDKVLALYDGFDIQAVDRQSTLAGDKTYRRVVTEAVISSSAST